MGTNGIISFGLEYNSWFNIPFPITSLYLLAPFWDDVDIGGGNGIISYEIHGPGYFLNQTNAFLQRKRPSMFEGTWMLVAHWDAVHPFFFGVNSLEVGLHGYTNIIIIKNILL